MWFDSAILKKNSLFADFPTQIYIQRAINKNLFGFDDIAQGVLYLVYRTCNTL